MPRTLLGGRLQTVTAGLFREYLGKNPSDESARRQYADIVLEDLVSGGRSSFEPLVERGDAPGRRVAVLAGIDRSLRRRARGNDRR